MTICYYIALLLITSWSPTVLASDASSHCGKEEQVVFNCHVKKKALSLCMPKSGSGKKNYMQYRFGPLNQPELIFPKALEPAAQNFFSSSADYSAGGEGRVRFSIGTYDYLVYSKITSGPPEKGGVRKKYSSSGMVILNNKKQIAVLQCTEKDADFHFPDGYLKEEEFNYDVDTP